MDETPWTVGKVLNWTADYFQQKDFDSPRLDAELLLAKVLRRERIQLYMSFADEVSDADRATFRKLVQQRAAGTPVAYLLGRKEFFSLDFRVTPDVLIPRPETEFAVVAVLDAIKAMPDAGRQGGSPRVADVGTGSGAIAVAVAVHCSQAHITAIDVSSAALEVARANASDHGVLEQIEFVECDLLGGIDSAKEPASPPFDVVVSNPPYVSEAEFEKLSVDVRDHEPRLALVAGAAGTEVISRLVDQAASRLSPRGALIIEISPMIESAVYGLLRDAGFTAVTTQKDVAKLARVVIATKNAD